VVTTDVDECAAARFTAMFKQCYPSVLAYAQRRTSPDQAADVAAEVFSTAWINLERIPADPLPWLYRTAWHAIGNSRRSKSRSATLALTLAGERMTDARVRDPADQVVAGERITRVLKLLSASDREAVLLVSWEELSIDDAAVVIGCTPGTLKVRLHRARRRLSTLLQQDVYSDNDYGLPVSEEIQS
jgi:RNA polymerase sigma-70 factor (ECF subfamily)